MCSGRGDGPLRPVRFPHSEIPGSKSGCRLPGAYRRLLRPSSAPGAKASTVCPYQLGNYRCDARVHCAVLKIRAVPVATTLTGWPAGPEPRVPDGRSLRTQQRARPANPSRPAFRSGRAGCTNRRELVRGPNNQCSTSEHPSSCSAPQRGYPAGVPGGRSPGLALRAYAKSAAGRRARSPASDASP